MATGWRGLLLACCCAVTVSVSVGLPAVLCKGRPDGAAGEGENSRAAEGDGGAHPSRSRSGPNFNRAEDGPGRPVGGTGSGSGAGDHLSIWRASHTEPQPAAGRWSGLRLRRRLGIGSSPCVRSFSLGLPFIRHPMTSLLSPWAGFCVCIVMVATDFALPSFESHRIHAARGTGPVVQAWMQESQS
jgi:hypothetical protein